MKGYWARDHRDRLRWEAFASEAEWRANMVQVVRARQRVDDDLGAEYRASLIEFYEYRAALIARYAS